MLSLEFVLVFCHGISKGGDCKVEFNRPFCWLYYVPNLLVIQHLETLYLGGNHLRIVCERVWRKTQMCATQQGLASGSRPASHQSGTRVKHAEKLKSYTSWSTTGQKFQFGQTVSSQLELATQSNRKAKSLKHSVWEKLTFRIPNTHQYKCSLYSCTVESFRKEFWERNPREKQDWLIHNLHYLILQIPLLSPSPLLHP